MAIRHNRPLAEGIQVERDRIELFSWLIVPLIGVLALIARCLGLADFMTIDEPYHWIGRVRRFTEALASGDWAATNQTGHPGVTTMWLGSLGRWLAATQGLYDGGRAGNSVEFLAMLRLPLAVTNGLAVVVGFLLLRRLVRQQVALVAAVLWALSPFLIAHSRLLHLDALLTSFMTLSVLSLLQIGHEESVNTTRSNLGALALSGFFAGLALLTKAPSLLLLPLIGLLLLLVSPPGSLFARLRWAIGWYLVWLVIACAVVFAGWPALWVAPREAIMTVIGEVIVNGGQPHHSGNFFLGQAVGDPGWLFYPAVILWRTTPITLVGLIVLPFALWRSGRWIEWRERRTLIGLLVFIASFTLAMSIEPKKFDRYLLPVWPSLEILAATGLIWLAEWRRETRDTERRFRVSRFTFHVSLLGALLLILVLQLGIYHPYYIGYFNPLLGGGAVAQRVMLVGWGEGMEDVGAWLNKRPDLASGPVLSVIGPTLSPFVSDHVLDLQEKFFKTNPSYVVLYARSQQRDESASAQEFVHTLTPLWTLRKYGIDYATVYQFPRPFDTPTDATFGDGLHLRGYSRSLIDNTVVITPSWDVQRDQAGGRFAFMHVIAPDGSRVAQADIPIDGGMFPNWQAGQQFGGPVTLTLPPELSAGSYRVVIGVYDPANGARLPLTVGSALPNDVAGEHALLLTTFER